MLYIYIYIYLCYIYIYIQGGQETRRRALARLRGAEGGQGRRSRGRESLQRRASVRLRGAAERQGSCDGGCKYSIDNAKYF